LTLTRFVVPTEEDWSAFRVLGSSLI